MRANKARIDAGDCASRVHGFGAFFWLRVFPRLKQIYARRITRNADRAFRLDRIIEVAVEVAKE